MIKVNGVWKTSCPNCNLMIEEKEGRFKCPDCDWEKPHYVRKTYMAANR